MCANAFRSTASAGRRLLSLPPSFAAALALAVVFLVPATPALALKQGCVCPPGTQPLPGANQTFCRNPQNNQNVPALCPLTKRGDGLGNAERLIYLQVQLAKQKQDLREMQAVLIPEVMPFTMALDLGIASSSLAAEKMERDVKQTEKEISEYRDQVFSDKVIADILLGTPVVDERPARSRPHQYAPLFSRKDPVSGSLGTAPEGFPPAEASSGREGEDAGLSVVGGTNVSRQTASSLSGSTIGGLPASIGGFSAVSTSSGGALRLDLSGPLNLGPDQRFAVAAGAWANTTSLNSYGGLGLGAPALPGGASGNGASVGGAAAYSFGPNWVMAAGLYNASDASVSTNGLGALGRFGAQGYIVAISAGRFFNLWSAKQAGIDILADGWKAVGLNLSGQVDGGSQRANSFVDSLGASHGVAGADRWTLGVAGRLEALYKAGRLLLIPFASAGFDYAPTSKVWAPDSVRLGGALLPGGVYSFDRTMGTLESGMRVTSLDLGGATFSASFRYQPASTTRTIGGTASVSIPLPAL